MTDGRSHGYFEGVGRLRLHYRSWEAADARGGLLLVHGLSDHSGRYTEFAEHMASVGLSTYALDLRGHGHSEGRRGHAASFELFLQDLERFRREVQGLTRPGLDLFLLGHSMGGLVALRYLEEYDAPLSGGILVSPWLGTALAVPRWKVNIARILGRILPALPIPANIPPEHLSQSPDVVEAFRADPLVHDRVTPRLFDQVAGAMGLAVRRIDRVRVPLLFLIAGSDRIVDARRSTALAEAFGRRAEDITIREYPSLYHELLNEPDRALVMADIRSWIDARHGSDVAIDSSDQQ